VSSLFSLKKIVHALFAVGQSPDGGHPFTRTSKYFEEEDELIIEAVVDLMEGKCLKADRWSFIDVSHWNNMTSSSKTCSFPDSGKLIFQRNMNFFLSNNVH
jgi:hypothetical protein